MHFYFSLSNYPIPLPNQPKMPPKTYTINLIGDVMLGRLIDQLWPQHVDNATLQSKILPFIEHTPTLASYTHSSPWGTTLPLFPTSDLNLINLETSATTSNTPLPNKAFNYRMHPANAIAALNAANIDYVCLANNHTLDFGTDGLVETVWTVKQANIAFAGAGETTDESRRPAVLSLPRVKKKGRGHAHGPGGQDQGQGQGEGQGYKIHVYSASDHPTDWAVVPTFHLIDYSGTTRRHLKKVLTASWPASHPDTNANASPMSSTSTATASTKSQPAPEPALKVFSVHWGPNYRWRPAEEIRSLAHYVIDECGVDVVHGHSSHHVQGVEKYKGKVIVYGCGDFVDDYALNGEFRNDLGAVWRVVVSEGGSGDQDLAGGLKLDRLEVFPSRVERFSANLLDTRDPDHGWVRRRVAGLSAEMGTMVNEELGSEGQVVFDLRE